MPLVGSVGMLSPVLTPVKLVKRVIKLVSNFMVVIKTLRGFYVADYS